MTKNKIRHIVALSMWTALFGYYLAWNFTWISFAFFAVTLLYLACTTVFPKRSNNDYVVWSLGNMLGASCGMLLIFYIINRIVPMVHVDLSAGIWAVIGSVFKSLNNLRAFSDFKITLKGIGSYLMLASAVVFFFASKSKSSPNLAILFKYLWSCALLAAVLNTNYHSVELIMLLLVITLAFVGCDVMSYQHDGRVNKAGKIWYHLLGILFLLVVDFKPGALFPFTDLDYLEHFFVFKGFKWYTALFILAVLLIGEYFMFSNSDTEEEKHQADIAFGWNAISILIVLFFISRFHVGYWWLLLLVGVIGAAIAIRVFNPVAAAEDDRKRSLSYWFMPILSAALIITAIAGFYGKLLITWTVIGCVLFVIDQYKRREPDGPWWKEARFYSAVLGAIAVCAGVALWSCNRIVFAYLLLGGMFLVSGAFVWALSFNSSIMPSRHRVLSVITTVCLAVLCISLCCESGNKIRVSGQDCGKVSVEVSSGKDREIVAEEYYWLDDYLCDNYEQDGFPKERKLESNNIPYRDGRLRIVVTDNYGSKSERICWIHTNKFD